MICPACRKSCKSEIQHLAEFSDCKIQIQVRRFLKTILTPEQFKKIGYGIMMAQSIITMIHCKDELTEQVYVGTPLIQEFEIKFNSVKELNEKWLNRKGKR